jgi:hypothetical protein
MITMNCLFCQDPVGSTAHLRSTAVPNGLSPHRLDAGLMAAGPSVPVGASSPAGASASLFDVACSLSRSRSHSFRPHASASAYSVLQTDHSFSGTISIAPFSDKS